MADGREFAKNPKNNCFSHFTGIWRYLVVLADTWRYFFRQNRGLRSLFCDIQPFSEIGRAGNGLSTEFDGLARIQATRFLPAMISRRRAALSSLDFKDHGACAP
jgi:hypothetical protein